MTVTYERVQRKPTTIILKEEVPSYTNQDQLFKQLIQTFFEEFFEAFFPQVHQIVNFEHITFLSEELFTGVFDGNKKVLDIVVEATCKETDAIIVIHVEPQSYKQVDFHERMFTYYGMLYAKLRKPIIPIAMFSYEDDWEVNEFTVEFPQMDIVRFNYLSLHLRKQNWRTFIKKDNPVAAALLSKMGYTEKERIQVKLEFFQIIAKLELNREKTDLLLGFFESYLKLSKAEEEQFMSEAKKLDRADEVLELTISYEERGKKIGIEEGKEIGIEEGKKVGFQQGKELERTSIAFNMLKKGYAIEDIHKLTQVSIDKIHMIKRGF